MQIDIPQLVFNARTLRPREERPKGILSSCDLSLKNSTTSAMGTTEEDFEFVIGDVLEGLLDVSKQGIDRKPFA